MQNELTTVTDIEVKVRSVFSEYEDCLDPSQFNKLVDYIVMMATGAENKRKLHLAFYGHLGKSTLTNKIVDFLGCSYYVADGRSKVPVDNVTVKEKLFIFREYNPFDVKKLTSGDMCYLGGNYTLFDKYAICEYNREHNLDDAMKAREIRIDIPFIRDAFYEPADLVEPADVFNLVT